MGELEIDYLYYPREGRTHWYPGADATWEPALIFYENHPVCEQCFDRIFKEQEQEILGLIEEDLGSRYPY